MYWHKLFNHINIAPPYRSSIIKEVTNSTDSKAVVFVANKKFGSELGEEIEDSAYMNAEINSKYPELMNRIIETETFDEKVSHYNIGVLQWL